MNYKINAIYKKFPGRCVSVCVGSTGNVGIRQLVVKFIKNLCTAKTTLKNKIEGFMLIDIKLMINMLWCCYRDK